MIEKTKGIIFRVTKFSESSLVVKVFTEVFGMRTYMVRGVRKKKSKTPMNLFQPLSILDMVVYEKAGRDIQHVKDVKAGHIFSSIPYEMNKTSMVIFLNEVLYKAIGEEETNENMFQFIFQSLQYLDTADEKYYNFHLWFLSHFTRFLGFEASDNFATRQAIFDMQEGRYTSLRLPETISIHPPLSALFHQLNRDKSFGTELIISREQRKQLLEKLHQYYQFHLPNFSELKSLQVLTEVMSS
ncbi:MULTISPECIES: DNA repair protein RecO [unclassified Lentimicrobium]|uniref:DNA repair protein RecO n=1 Tax=unclassified Lentimicrobium TaxID=2677434 RepID=UPI001552243F|nr:MULTISPECIES: DNA repair protein RecO [unclassified Lentimicrobium]NPD45135.1 DNA repair protein RecO [Lentimicrobium sp. S6]NPD86549.1 DNA repair protein RecO [Lentimicrobium sp. L6]